MEKFFRLNKPVYHKSDVVRVSDKYSKREGGYIINCEYVELTPLDDGKFVYGKLFCPEYYNMGGDGYTMIVESGRRNAKKAALAEKAMENAREYAERYIAETGNGLEIIEEVA
jgi:hypothetical protein